MSVQPASSSTSPKEGSLCNLDEAASILRVTSYHRKDFDLAVIHLNPHKFGYIRSSLFKSFASSLDANLGRLESFPLEILTSVCLFLDISTAFHFSHVNRRAREIVATIREYRQLSEHAIDCVCALLRTGVASRVSITSLYSALSTKNCHLCGSFSGFLFLSTATRCCFSCIETAPSLRATSLAKLSKASGVPVRQLKKSIPTLHTLSGVYTMEEVTRTRRTFIVAESHCLDALKRNEIKESQLTFDLWSQSPILRFMASSSLPFLDPITEEIQTGVSCRGCQLVLEAAPSEARFDRRERVYSREEFLDHFHQCEEARNLWVLSQGGTVPIEEPFMAQQGGFFNERYTVPL
ncbi:F-box domain-containing protein [Colletotrichum higginsianum]|uniref:F-box domain-containing protein n=1 Tax=Colletotrichum higginsianum (strain IMI 349063) TaxID=759273 RepID=H1VAM4_COLHI|nr:F-box domain-containing protein [Colletotrichum higginsianum]